MSDTVFLGQIEVFAFDWPPAGFAKCDGQLLSVQQNPALFALLGTVFGGDGRNTFALPDLRSRTPIGPGQGPGLSNRVQGDMVGEENHAVTVDEMGTHTHALRAQPGKGTQATPAAATVIAKGVLKDESGKLSDLPIYAAPPSGQRPSVSMDPASIQPSGGSVGHNNLMPYLTLNVCISLVGPTPPR